MCMRTRTNTCACVCRNMHLLTHTGVYESMCTSMYIHARPAHHDLDPSRALYTMYFTLQLHDTGPLQCIYYTYIHTYTYIYIYIYEYTCLHAYIHECMYVYS